MGAPDGVATGDSSESGAKDRYGSREQHEERPSLLAEQFSGCKEPDLCTVASTREEVRELPWPTGDRRMPELLCGATTAFMSGQDSSHLPDTASC